jgi:hypothetical protein
MIASTRWISYDEAFARVDRFSCNGVPASAKNRPNPAAQVSNNFTSRSRAFRKPWIAILSFFPDCSFICTPFLGSSKSIEQYLDQPGGGFLGFGSG